MFGKLMCEWIDEQMVHFPALYSDEIQGQECDLRKTWHFQ